MNATFGSITEITFYITALLRGHRAGTRCYEEIVKAALTGTLLGCILFIPVSAPPRLLKFDAELQPFTCCISALLQGICMIIGGIKHREQRFNSRSAGVSSALLFISIGGILHHPLNANLNAVFWKLTLTQEQKWGTYFCCCVVHRCVCSNSVFKDIRWHGVWQLLRHPRQHHRALHLQRLSLRHGELLILTLHYRESRI